MTTVGHTRPIQTGELDRIRAIGARLMEFAPVGAELHRLGAHLVETVGEVAARIPPRRVKA